MSELIAEYNVSSLCENYTSYIITVEWIGIYVNCGITNALNVGI